MVSAPSSLVWIANWVFIRPTTFRALASSTTWRRSSAWVSADSEYGGSEQEESPGSVANGADVAIKLLNAVMTVVALLLVDRKGRKFLLMLGSGGICVALLAAAALFFQAERGRADVQPQLQVAVSGDGLQLVLDDAQWQRLSNGIDSQGRPMQLTVSYAYGDFTNVRALRSDNLTDRELRIERAGSSAVHQACRLRV